MAISFNTGAKNSTTTSASVTLAIPAGVLTGDVMILVIEAFTETGTAPTISFSGAGGSWTLVPMTSGTNPEVATAGSSIWNYGWAYYRVATSGDPGQTLTITESGSAAGTTWLSVAMAAYTGASNSAPIDVAFGNNAQGVASTTAPSGSTTVANDWAVHLAAAGINTAPLTGPGTSRENVVSSASIAAALDDSNGSVGAGGTTIGGGTWAQAGNTSNWFSLFTIGLSPPTGPPPVPAPLYPLTSPARARVPQNAPRGRTYGNRGAPVQNPPPPPGTPGPPFAALTQPPGVRVIIVRQGAAAASRIPVAAVVPPVVTPAPFYPLTSPARARIPAAGPRGRVTRSTGGPLRNPTAPVYPLAGPVRVRLPQLQPRAGRVYGSRGAPLANPTAGPAFRLPTQPARARIPQVFSRGRAEALRSQVANPTPGPQFTQATSPARTRIPATFSKGRVYSNAGAPVRNPGTGPAFRLPAAPAQARRPLPPRGRTYGNPGAPVQNPRGATAPVYPLHQPVRARQPLPAPGRAATMSLLPNPANPTQGPAFALPTAPARARRPLPPRGRVSGNLGAPVVPPPPPAPLFHLPTQPARTRIPRNGPRGRYTANPASAVRNPTAGPAFHLPVQPVRARQPLPPRGRAYSNPGAPVRNPVTPTSAPLRPLTSPARARLGQVPFLPGRAATMAVLPFPVPPVVISPVYPLTTPVRARQPLPPRGRVYGITPAPPPVITPVPQAPLSQPASARVSFLRAGQTQFTTSTPAAAPAPPPVVPFRPSLNKALRAQPPVFLKGRIITTPRGPVRNPTSGPPAPELRQPVRYRITLPPRGRNSGNQGGPLRNPVPVHILPPAIATVTPFGPLAATAVIAPSGPLAAEMIPAPSGALAATATITLVPPPTGLWTVEPYGPLAAEATITGNPLN